MHAMSGELDMRKMSGLKRVLPITNIVMLVGCLALAGFPAVSGFFSKDEIIGADFPRHWIFGASLLVAAFMTAYYTFRLYFRVFWGPLVVPEAPAQAHGHGHESHEHATASHSAISTGTAPQSGVDEGQTHHAPGHSDHADGEHNHEPWIMMAPLVLLAIGAVFIGYMDFPFHNFGRFIGHSPSLGHAYQIAASTGVEIPGERFGQEIANQPRETEYTVMIVSGLISVAGIALAFYLHLLNRTLSDQIARLFQPLTGLIENKYYVDEIYQAVIVEPLWALGRWLWAFDRWVVDGIVNLVGGSPVVPGWFLKLTLQRGYLQGYAAAMVLGIVVILLCMFF